MMEIISDTLGKVSATQIRQTARGFVSLASNWNIETGGFLLILFFLINNIKIN